MPRRSGALAHWSPEEVELLKHYAAGKHSAQHIKEFFPNRSINSIYSKAAHMGLHLGVAKRYKLAKQWPRVMLRLDPDTKSRLEDLSEDYKVNQGDLIRWIVLWFHQAVYPERSDNVADAAE